MKNLLILLFLAGLSAKGQVTQTATITAGVRAPKIGLPIATPHNHPASPLIFENFEGTGYATAGWGEAIGGGGTVNEDYTATALDPVQSLYIDGPTDEVSYATNGFTANSAPFAYIQFRIVSAPATEDYLSIFRFRDVNGATVFKMQVDSSLFPRITTGGQSSSTLAAISTGVTYHCWLSWNKDNGANSVATMAISISKVQPTSGDNYVTVSNGTQVANNAQQVFLGYANDTVDDSGPEMTIIYDYVLVDDVAIPDYP